MRVCVCVSVRVRRTEIYSQIENIKKILVRNIRKTFWTFPSRDANWRVRFTKIFFKSVRISRQSRVAAVRRLSPHSRSRCVYLVSPPEASVKIKSRRVALSIVERNVSQLSGEESVIRQTGACTCEERQREGEREGERQRMSGAEGAPLPLSLNLWQSLLIVACNVKFAISNVIFHTTFYKYFL